MRLRTLCVWALFALALGLLPVRAAWAQAGCGVLQPVEQNGFLDGTLAIGDLLSWEFTDVDTEAVLRDVYTIDLRALSGLPGDQRVLTGTSVAVRPVSLAENDVLTWLRVARTTWNPADSAGTVSVATACSLSVRLDNTPPAITAGCLLGGTVINGNYIDNSALAGRGDTLRLSWATSGACDGGPSVGGHRVNDDAAHLAVWFDDFLDSLLYSGAQRRYPVNAAAVGLQTAGNDTLAHLWVGRAFSSEANDTLYVDIPFNATQWPDSVQLCIAQALAAADTIYAWGLDDAGNRSNRSSVDGGLCLDNVPPPAELGSEIYYETCGARFSPPAATNLSPDSTFWFKDKVDTAYNESLPRHVFEKVYLIGFGVRTAPDEDPDAATGALVAMPDYVHPSAPLGSVHGLPWEFYGGVDDTTSSVRFVWYGKQGASPSDAALSPDPAFWNCDYGLLLGVSLERWMDAAGNNRIIRADHDLSTDIDDNYTTLNQLQTVVDLCPPRATSAADTLHFAAALPAGPLYDPDGPGGLAPLATYEWAGPNGVLADPRLVFRVQRNFTQGLADECLREGSLAYRVRVDSLSIPGGASAWTPGADSVFYFSAAHAAIGVATDEWTPIAFNANDINSPVIAFNFGHRFSGGYLPDGLYRLTLEVKDPAGNVYREAGIVLWLSGSGPEIDVAQFVDAGSVCRSAFAIGQDACVRVVTDATATSVLVDWSCVPGITADADSALLTAFENQGGLRVWTACLPVTADLIDADPANNIWELDSARLACVSGEGHIPVRVTVFDGAGFPTRYDAPPSNPCRLATVGAAGCATFLRAPEFSFYDPDSLELNDGDFRGRVAPYDVFAPAPRWNAISPGSIGGSGGAGEYDARLNPARDDQQDSVWVRLLLDLAAVSADTSDTLVLRFTNDMGTASLADDRVREIRKGLFHPAAADMFPDPISGNTWYDGFQELWNLDLGVLEFRYLWHGTWFEGAGTDSLMLVPLNTKAVVRVSAVVIEGADGSECAAIPGLLRVDNTTPDFAEVFPLDTLTGTTATVENLRPRPVCGTCYGDGDRFRLRVRLTEEVHYDAAAYPNEAGSHSAANGDWPLTRGWQISPIDLRTGKVVGFGPDSMVVMLDSVLVDKRSDSEVYYTLSGSLHFPAATPLPYDSVALVIRAAWDQGGNPARYNNPVFDDAWRFDSAEDTSFRIILHPRSLAGTATAAPSVAIPGPCGDRCRLDNATGAVTAVFEEDGLDVTRVWLSVVRADGLFAATLGDLTVDALDTNRYRFDFGGNLCGFWQAHALDMGCYRFTVHFTDNTAAEDSLSVTMACAEGMTDLICIDCEPSLPAAVTLDSLRLTRWDCVANARVTQSPAIDAALAEIGGRAAGVGVLGRVPVAPQYVRALYLWAESADAPFAAAIIDSVIFDTTYASAGRAFVFDWNTPAQTGGGAFVYPTGHYRLWVDARDAVCQAQITDSFAVLLDQQIPAAAIALIDGHAPSALAPDTIDAGLGGDSTVLRIAFTDGLVPDDSTQMHNRVRVWAKRQSDPNVAVAWFDGGLVTFPFACDPHVAVLHNTLACDATYDLVAVATDAWGADAELNASAAVLAFAAGRTMDVRVVDTTPPVTQLWGLTLPDGRLVPFDQQTFVAAIGGGVTVTLNAFTANGDETVDNVRFQYSLDALAWTDIATDNAPAAPPSCAALTPPLPWWCGVTDAISWQAVWPLGNLRGDVYVRVVATDRCGNSESDAAVYVLSIDVDAAIARVFVWRSDIHVDTLNCANWAEPQIGATMEPQTILTLGACPDTAMHDAYGALWFIKRADDQPLAPGSWCALGDDSTAPFSLYGVNLWSGPCAVPQPGVSYDIAALTTDRFGNRLTFAQLLNYGQGATWEEKWQWLIDHFYVKRFRAVDTTAPVAFDLMAGPDHTPDSSAIFLTGNVTLTAHVTAPDVVAVTFAVRLQGASGPWTVIERVVGDSGAFAPVEGHWNTELLNGIYVLGAFAEDASGNIDGDLSGAGAGPHSTLEVHVDNQRPTADIVSVTAGGLPVAALERGRAYQWALSASDNFAVRYITLLARRQGGDPAAWVPIDTAFTQPYTIAWTVPPRFVVGWTYEFAAVATDLVHLTDLTDPQQQYLVDTSFTITDNEADIALVTIGGQDAASLPHINGRHVALVAHSDGNLNNARFELVIDGDTTVIGVVEGAFGQTVWTLPGWDVTLLPEDTVLIGVVGLADVGGSQVARGADYRRAIIDHRLIYTVDETTPASHALIGGVCALSAAPQTDVLSIDLAPGVTDIDTVRFEWKRTADPDAENYWQLIGYGRHDAATNAWSLAWDAGTLPCGLIDLRARLGDNAVPESNEDTLRFADSVRVDNCPPLTDITNINGDVTPENATIARGQVATIIATVSEPAANGGSGAIDSVCFYAGPVASGDSVHEWMLIGCDTDGEPWQALWNTGAANFAAYEIRAVAWDEAGNCGVDANRVTITDQLYQRAWIVGYDTDNGFGCQDRLWAVTDDCEPNFTSSVRFQYSTNNGAAWVSLGSDAAGERFCEAGLDYNVWMIAFEADSVPAGAVYRAVATDEAANDDPNPPRFLFNDVTLSNTPVIYNEDLVRVPVTAGQVPWVFSVLETGTTAQNCFTAGALVCVNPAAGNPALYQGVLDATVKPCVLNGTDGRETVFSGVPVDRAGTTFMLLTRYQMAIHAVSAAAGSNGWQLSEDNQAQIFVPTDGVSGIGTLWFEPEADSGAVAWIPPSQPWYSLLSRVEYVMTKDLAPGLHAPQYRLRFNPALLPADAQSWQVVAAYFDAATGLWQSQGVVYTARDLSLGRVDFSFAPQTSWSASDLNPACPNKLAVAVLLTAVQPLAAWVRIGDDACATAPDSANYTPARGPTTDCTPTFFATLREGEFVPARADIDVYLDSLRIMNDGVAAAGFSADYDVQTGVLSFALAPEAAHLPPFFGCLGAGAHSVQIFVGDRQTNPTPFFVDATPPVIHAAPGWVQAQILLGADIVDDESAIDTTALAVVLRNCAVTDGPALRLGADRLNFAPIAHGYHVTLALPWDQVQHLFAAQELDLVDQLCVHWEAANAVCLRTAADEALIYLRDAEGPQVTPLTPVGDALDEDQDGLANEDPRDCLDNDADNRIDEDPVTFATDTLTLGQRPPIEFRVSDLATCGSGATGLVSASLRLEIDGHGYTLADTANAALAFHVELLGGRELLVRFGGPASGAAADTHYTPGEHRIAISIADSLGNRPAPGTPWAYFIRAAAPLIVFADSARDCGLWFDPETVSTFHFCVDATPAAPLRPDGIRYTLYAVPGGTQLLGPVVVHPANPLHECVTVSFPASLPDAASGVELVVAAFNVQSTPEDSAAGGAEARFTYWADRTAPLITGHAPLDGATFSRNEPIIVDVFFNDDAPALLAATNRDGRGKTEGALAAAVKAVRTTSKTGSGAGSLDGSGIDTSGVTLTLVTPDGQSVPLTQFAELDNVHARVILPVGQAAGRNTLSARVADCVGNAVTVSWTITITGDAPEIAFLPAAIDTACEREGFWSPGHPLRLRATVRETDNVNITRTGLRVDILRVSACQSGLCIDTLLPNAPVVLGATLPDPADAAQTFELSGVYPLPDAANALELRITVAATNVLGVTAHAAQSVTVDAAAPWIQPLSPVSGAVLPDDLPVTLSAVFGDGEMMAAIAGTRVAPAAPSKSGPLRPRKDTAANARTTTHAKLGAWSGAVAGSLDETATDSGVDTVCVVLQLAQSGGVTRDLTAEALISPSGITWTDTLAEGHYTALLSVCDRVCNTAHAQWNFEVSRHAPGIDTQAPLIVSVDPNPADTLARGAAPEFVVGFAEQGRGELDFASLQLRLETAAGDTVRGVFSVDIAPNRLTATASLRVATLPGGTYRLFAVAQDLAGNRVDSLFTYVVGRAADGEDPATLLNEVPYNYPNPFDAGGNTRFWLPLSATGGAEVEIRIYDFAGQLVKNLYSGTVTAATVIEWNGTNNSGARVAGGVYLAHIRLGAAGRVKEDIVKVAFRSKQ